MPRAKAVAGNKSLGVRLELSNGEFGEIVMITNFLAYMRHENAPVPADEQELVSAPGAVHHPHQYGRCWSTSTPRARSTRPPTRNC